MTFHIITIFPEIFESYLNEGIIKQARKKEKINIKIYNLRDYTKDKHRTVDDTPYGGGPGMVLKVNSIFRCVEDIKSKISEDLEKTKIILFSAKGRKYSQSKAKIFSSLKHLVLICGRYEGVDERVAEKIIDEEISIGDYILTGGEIPAMILTDSISRLIPGVLGNKKSLETETYNTEEIDYPVYTKPEIFNKWKVPDVLLSGNHEKIKEWRKEKQQKTKNDKE